jgi:hypothetical protein
LKPFPVLHARYVGATFEQLAAEGYDAVYIWPSPFAIFNKARIAAAALQYRLPAISDTTEYARSGVHEYSTSALTYEATAH